MKILWEPKIAQRNRCLDSPKYRTWDKVSHQKQLQLKYISKRLSIFRIFEDKTFLTSPSW